MAKNIYGPPMAKNVYGHQMAKNIYGPPMAINTYSQRKKWQKTKFLENGDKTTTKVKPRSASVPLCSRLKNLQIIYKRIRQKH